MDITSVEQELNKTSFQIAQKSTSDTHLSFWQYARECKKATRILRDIAHDLTRQRDGIDRHNKDNRIHYQGPYYQGPRPSTWLLRCLVHTHLCNSPNTDWIINIYWTLNNIEKCSASDSQAPNSFRQLDGITPLIPNTQNFTLKHIHAFSKAAQKYLATQYSQLQ